jgi:asparagine synthase (glutamine-hydrolysing)
MCGVLAVIGRRVEREVLQRGIESLRHRGPDNLRTYEDPSLPVGLAHARLSIMDPTEGAHQPLFSQDRELVLVANGEIYDFEAIRDELAAKGHVFATRSDSEVILYLYKEYGLEFTRRLRGEFAFILVDRKKKKCYCVRDRFGIKPLFVGRARDGAFVVASEMKAIFATGLVEARLNAPYLITAFCDFLSTYFAGPLLYPFLDIGDVAPGTILEIDLETLARREIRYWRPDLGVGDSSTDVTSSAAFERSAREARERLDEAVRIRLRADVPVGVYLSGGIDSSFVAALARRHAVGPLHAFAISFPDGQDEAPLAREMAARLGVEYHVVAADEASLWGRFEDTLWHSEMLVSSLAQTGKNLLSELAAKYVKVVLTGEGSDEIFLGYPEFVPLLERTRRKEAFTPAPLYQLLMQLFQRQHTKGLPRVDRAAAAREAADRFASEQIRGRPPVVVHQFRRVWRMPAGILAALGDRAEMAHSLEARTPFLDHVLVDFARTLPLGFKIRDGVEKAVVREAARDLVPLEVIERRKLGFAGTGPGIQVRRGRFAALDSLIDRFLSREAFERAGVFDYAAFRALRKVAEQQRWLGRLSPGRFVVTQANLAILGILQAHILHHRFVEAGTPTRGSALR